MTGFDIDAAELAKAPRDYYDDVIVGDVTTYSPSQTYDVVVTAALLEHVCDVGAALKTICRFARPDGKILLFLPSRNAWFARLNLLLSEDLKRRILFTIFPKARARQGFPA